LRRKQPGVTAELLLTVFLLLLLPWLWVLLLPQLLWVFAFACTVAPRQT
jgi:hypothetical protein